MGGAPESVGPRSGLHETSRLLSCGSKYSLPPCPAFSCLHLPSPLFPRRLLPPQSLWLLPRVLSCSQTPDPRPQGWVFPSVTPLPPSSHGSQEGHASRQQGLRSRHGFGSESQPGGICLDCQEALGPTPLAAVMEAGPQALTLCPWAWGLLGGSHGIWHILGAHLSSFLAGTWANLRPVRLSDLSLRQHLGWGQEA